MNDRALSFRQTWEDRVDFKLNASQSQAAYAYSRALPKACLHPLVTPKGHVLTGFMMSDHIWHRALWFTIKLINGTNYWEEQEAFGVHQSISEPKVDLLSEDSAQITHELEWKAETTVVVFKEKRLLQVASDAEGITHLTWRSTLQATQTLVLDRTPYTTWGGYSGLSIRASREMHEAKFIVPGGKTVEALTGQTHDWAILEGRMDGGPGEFVSIGIIDHPENPRSPSPWYCKTNNAGFTFMNAAFLFHEPLKVEKGEELHFHYKIVYRDGTWKPDEFQSIADKFRKTRSIL